jgi:hypothetical protein
VNRLTRSLLHSLFFCSAPVRFSIFLLIHPAPLSQVFCSYVLLLLYCFNRFTRSLLHSLFICSAPVRFSILLLLHSAHFLVFCSYVVLLLNCFNRFTRSLPHPIHLLFLVPLCSILHSSAAPLRSALPGLLPIRSSSPLLLYSLNPFFIHSLFFCSAPFRSAPYSILLLLHSAPLSGLLLIRSSSPLLLKSLSPLIYSSALPRFSCSDPLHSIPLFKVIFSQRSSSPLVHSHCPLSPLIYSSSLPRSALLRFPLSLLLL